MFSMLLDWMQVATSSLYLGEQNSSWNAVPLRSSFHAFGIVECFRKSVPALKDTLGIKKGSNYASKMFSMFRATSAFG